MKSIVLCADDYGQAPAISEAILTLVKMRRLSAVSCMVNLSDWADTAPRLAPFHDQVNIGLHLNFTHGAPLSDEFKNKYGHQFFTLSSLMLKSFFRQLDEKVIVAEIIAQINRFQKEMGFLPDFIDGHQHVHQFPIIRDALLKAFLSKLSTTTGFIRLVNIQLKIRDLFFNPKKWVIYFMGTRALEKLLLKAGVMYNLSFSGVYDFKKSTHYQHYFLNFLSESDTGGLIMCHPGLKSTDENDGLRKSRHDEFMYFSGESFLKDCDSAQIKLYKFQSK